MEVRAAEGGRGPLHEGEPKAPQSNSSRRGPAEETTLETGEGRSSSRDVGQGQSLLVSEGAGSNRQTRGNKRKQRAFDWSRAQFQRVLLKIAYNGENFAGLAAQAEDSGIPTIEDALFKAMEKACLIPNRSACNFSRCGRTDKGVHAAGNYISLNLRVLDKTAGLPDGCKAYVSLLNRLLPPDIRVLAATLVPQTFDARFDCLYRVYKYFFAIEGLDIKLMQKAAKQFVGSHNFLRFCKVDRKQERSLRRRIIRFEVQPESNGFAVATIVGVSFLWHQVRFMMAALMDVGSGLRSEAFISSLLKEGLDSEVERSDDASSESAAGHSAVGAVRTEKEESKKTKSGSRSELPLRPAPAGNLVLYDCCFEGLYFHRSGVVNRLVRSTAGDSTRFKSEAGGLIEQPPTSQNVPRGEYCEKPTTHLAKEEAAAPEAGDEQLSCHLPRCTEESRSFQDAAAHIQRTMLKNTNGVHSE
ncbi:hypothetical protein Emed_000157 [Eimeria media]